MSLLKLQLEQLNHSYKCTLARTHATQCNNKKKSVLIYIICTMQFPCHPTQLSASTTKKNKTSGNSSAQRRQIVIENNYKRGRKNSMQNIWLNKQIITSNFVENRNPFRHIFHIKTGRVGSMDLLYMCNVCSSTGRMGSERK